MEREKRKLATKDCSCRQNFYTSAGREGDELREQSPQRLLLKTCASHSFLFQTVMADVFVERLSSILGKEQLN